MVIGRPFREDACQVSAVNKKKRFLCDWHRERRAGLPARSGFILLLAGCLGFAGFAGGETAGRGPSVPASAPTWLRDEPRRLILFDVHDHLTPGLSPDKIVQLMDEAGVGRIVLMANRGATAEELLQAQDRHPGRVIIFVPVAGWGWQSKNPGFVTFAQGLLQSGRFKGMGEFMLKHYPVAPQGGVASPKATDPGRDPEARTKEAPMIDVPPDSALMRSMWALAGQAQVPVIFHMETDGNSVATLERTLADFPRVSFIWAHQNPVKTHGGRFEEHARRGDPGLLRGHLARYPNLYADISLGYESIFYRPAGDRNLPEAWKALYEEYSDRFMIGMDNAYREQFERFFGRRAGFMRDWLAQLSPEAAERIGCSNAHRLILRTQSRLTLESSTTEVRRGEAVTVQGSLEPVFPGVRIDRILEGPGGQENALLWTDAKGRFREEIVLAAAGVYRLKYRALCDGNQPGAQAAPIALRAKE